MDLYNMTELYGTVRFSLQQDFTTFWNYTTEVSLQLRNCVSKEKKKKYVLKVDA